MVLLHMNHLEHRQTMAQRDPSLWCCYIWIIWNIGKQWLSVTQVCGVVTYESFGTEANNGWCTCIRNNWSQGVKILLRKPRKLSMYDIVNRRERVKYWEKVISYAVQYPALRTVQLILHFTPWQTCLIELLLKFSTCPGSTQPYCN